MGSDPPLRSVTARPGPAVGPTSVAESALRRSLLRTGIAFLVAGILGAVLLALVFFRYPWPPALPLIGLGITLLSALAALCFLYARQQVPRIEFYPWGFKVVGARDSGEFRAHDLIVRWEEVAEFEPGRFQFQFRGPEAKSWKVVRSSDAAESRAIVNALDARWREAQGVGPAPAPTPREALAWEPNPEFPKIRAFTWGFLVVSLVMTFGGGAYWVYHSSNLLSLMTWLLGVMFVVLALLAFAFFGDVPRRIALGTEGIHVDYGRTPSDPASLEAARWEEVAKVKGFGLHPTTEKGYDAAIDLELHSGVVLSLRDLPRGLARKVVAAARPEKVHLLTEEEALADAEEQVESSLTDQKDPGSA